MLATRGYRVAGAARRGDRIAQLPGVVPVQLDLTDGTSIADAVGETERRCGPIEILINNAGYGEFGSLEETPIDRARHQFDVNVFGLAALTQRALAPMRKARRGRIVNVSSLAGEFSSPMGGWYHASKSAVEALSDSLRLEVHQFGIAVTLVQPGPVHTTWHEESLAHLKRTSGQGPYATMASAVEAYHRKVQHQPITSEVDTVATVIVRAATTPNPKPRYRVGRGANIAVALSRLPDRVFDNLTRRRFGLT